MNLVLLTILLVVFVILFIGILYIYWPGSCNSINICPSGQSCLNGKCVTKCSSSNDCPTGQICYNKQCIPNVSCSSTNPCPNGQTCLGGLCVPNIGCSSSNPCTSGQQCINKNCVPACITTSTLFNLQSINLPYWDWHSQNGLFFLKSNGGSLNIINTSPPLDTSFQFIFQKNGCSNNNQNINYGDLVQLSSYNLLNAQCGAGTCSLNSPDNKSCQTGSWQTFIISSPTGKTGQVCFGDQIRLTQTAGSKCSISAGTPDSGVDMQSVYCTNGGNLSIFTILPVN